MKRALRAQVQEVLGKLSPARVAAQSEVITHNVLRSAAYQSSRAISCYLTMEHATEVETHALVLHALEAGKKVYVPRVNRRRYLPKGSQEAKAALDAGVAKWMSMLRLYSVQDMQTLQKNSWGIPEPGPTDGPDGQREDVLGPACEGLDLILMPGVAFDRNLGRVGHGAGFYDRWLSDYAKYKRQPKPTLMGLALLEQIVDRVPMEKNDWPLDQLVTPEGILPEGTLPEA
ncbi:5-formyltetrahydrofolate cyclo-ligase [Calocera cornea HHB12733]|uniref:5-formyltetrahydrofolate cyclo-ligase n=1 Tax=Calocera cornea HHB12733 TaxID=1353952 RepID=A0A165KB23_9BASI|nr:5-formyltetrahydrofolate cyclo-ligase [Calocera cornea HHB12733]